MKIYKVEAPDGSIIELEGPNNATDAQIMQAAQAAYAARPTAAPAAPAPAPARPSIAQQVLGAGETALTLGTAATGGLLGTVGGAISEGIDQARAGRFGTPAAARAIAQRAAAGAQQYTYQPRTEAGQEQVQALGALASNLPPVLPGALPAGMFGQSIQQAAPIVQATAARAVAAATPSRLSRGATRGSAGAAATPMEMQRTATAQGLPVPIDLTKGAASREAQQLSFEKEQIKGPLGAPLIERSEANNKQALDNFDALVDMTGSRTTATGPAATGNAVIDALSKGWQGAKAQTSAAYNAAKNSPEANALVDLSQLRQVRLSGEDANISLFDYLNSKPTGVPSSAMPDTAKQYAVNLGIATRDEQGNLVPTGAVTVQQMEQLRKEINAATGIDPVARLEATNLKKLIDATTSEVAGPLYSKARALREKQAIKYENRGVVANLLTTIKGKDDPKVAASEAFEKSILNATPEEVTFLRRVLLTSGKDGQQAMKELQGATIKHLENMATSGLQTDSVGRPVISPAKLNSAVNALDSDGRLDIILGKQQAQVVRDLNEVVKYVQTVPPGTLINNSGTAMALMAAIGEAGATGAMTGLPVPVLSVLRAVTQQMKNNKTKARILQSLNKAEEAKK